ncbi:MAG: D-aminoacyl-tRNA deacylase [Bacilli bacterium]|jgi:D-tyrosyl-tRNA(Tyr) deacylase|nr:D-aminoacyl-tRNA deacylase [Clostridium sp.]MDY3798488.1 D-aminoacyl-tRNA deacylase [Bacilli bacterium]CDE95306.1 d-tyrosyl-tRNA(Tyr) deacylase [Clostridium sp. CAG:914]
MRVLVQRCDKANVKVDSNIVGSIDKGLMILVGFTEGDNFDTIKYMVDKIVNLRVFDDENGIMNKSLLDKSFSILSVSQFTLYGDASKGRRPSYINALNGSLAKPLYDKFNEELRKYGIKVETGIFGGDMKVELINDGPVTIMLER